MSVELTLNRTDLGKINDIVNEFEVNSFKLIYDKTSGIGYTIDLEYTAAMKSRQVLVRIPIVGTESW